MKKHSQKRSAEFHVYGKMRLMIFSSRPRTDKQEKTKNQQNIIWREKAAVENFPHFDEVEIIQRADGWKKMP